MESSVSRQKRVLWTYLVLTINQWKCQSPIILLKYYLSLAKSAEMPCIGSYWFTFFGIKRKTISLSTYERFTSTLQLILGHVDFIISRIGDLSTGINSPLCCWTTLTAFLNFMETCFLLFSRQKNNSKLDTLGNIGLGGVYKSGRESQLQFYRCYS